MLIYWCGVPLGRRSRLVGGEKHGNSTKRSQKTLANKGLRILRARKRSHSARLLRPREERVVWPIIRTNAQNKPTISASAK